MTFDEPDGATPLGPDEMIGLKFRHITTRGELDELEQANIQQGLLWLGRQRGGDILSDEFVRTLHKRLFGDCVGLGRNLPSARDKYRNRPIPYSWATPDAPGQCPCLDGEWHLRAFRGGCEVSSPNG